jgi:hypothetical protein
MNLKFLCVLAAGWAAAATAFSPPGGPDWDWNHHRKTCTVEAGGSELIDDGPAIRSAFYQCGRGGKVAFLNTTYHVNTILNTTGLEDCEIDLQGTLLVRSFFYLSTPIGRSTITAAADRNSPTVGNEHHVLAQ